MRSVALLFAVMLFLMLAITFAADRQTPTPLPPLVSVPPPCIDVDEHGKPALLNPPGPCQIEWDRHIIDQQIRAERRASK